jgi:hypothetical protein
MRSERLPKFHRNSYPFIGCIRLGVELNRCAVDPSLVHLGRPRLHPCEFGFHEEEVMGVFRDAMREAMALRGFAPKTRSVYLSWVRRLVQFCRVAPDRLTACVHSCCT